MIDLGIVKPGKTIRIPFSSFDKDDGSAITMTNFAAADILVYKDGGTTERASTAGFTATTDFDSKTGKHLAIIDLADNTTAGFFNAGSEYLIAVDAVTVDGVTTGGWIARFTIGYRDAILDTTIATLSSQISFTLTDGPAEDDALNDSWAIIHDIASAVQLAKVQILDYTGPTKTVTLAAGATFTAAAGDNISVMGPMPMQPATTARKPVVDASGLVDANTVKLGPTGSGTAQTARDVGSSVLLSTGTGTGQLDFTSGVVKANLAQILGTALTETAGLLAGGFKKFFNIATPASTMDALTLVATATNLTNAPTNGDLTATMKTSVTTAATAATPTAAAVTGAVGSIATGGIAAASFAAGAIDNAAIAANAIGASELAADAVTEIQSGLALASALATAQTAITGIKAVTDVIPNAGALTDLKADTAAILDDTGTSGVIVAAASKTGYRLSATGVGDLLTTALTESYAADGAAPTVSQALFAIQQMMQERSITTTTMTVNKLDGTTAAFTLTLNDATSPSAITRAT